MGLHPNENRYTLGICVILMVLLSWITFANLATHLFDTDDHEFLELGAAAERDLSQFFLHAREAVIRPPFDLIFLAAYRLWKHDPAPYHKLQVALHLAASLLLALTFRRMGANLTLSLLAAAFFLMNVAHFRVVHWISCMHYTLGLIFTLCALLGYSRLLACGRLRWMAFSAGMLAIAISAHPSTMVVSLFCAYLAWRGSGSILRTAALS